MNTVTVVIFGVGAILIYTAARGDGKGGYSPVVLMRSVLSGQFKGQGKPEKPKNPSGFDLRPDRPATASNIYYSPNVPI